MTTVKLFDGGEMPTVGLGTWKSKPGAVEDAVKAAIDAGYKHIDCAWIYGNEKEVGTALKEKFDSGTKREELFIVSKLWNTKHHAEDVRPMVLDSLEKLGLKYLDLYLIHWPLAFKAGDEKFPKDEGGNMIYDTEVHYMETWKELEKCVEEGLIKYIGLSNFNSEQVTDVCMNGKIQPAVNQVECHPYLNQNQLLHHCKKHNVVMTAYSPLGSIDRPWAVRDEPRLLENPKLINLGEKYGKSPAQICIRFQVQRGLTVIPKSTTLSRIKENIEVFDFKLTDEDMKEIESLNIPWRAVVPMKEVDGKRVERDASHPLYPFNIPF